VTDGIYSALNKVDSLYSCTFQKVDWSRKLKCSENKFTFQQHGKLAYQFW